MCCCYGLKLCRLEIRRALWEYLCAGPSFPTSGHRFPRRRRAAAQPIQSPFSRCRSLASRASCSIRSHEPRAGISWHSFDSLLAPGGRFSHRSNEEGISGGGKLIIFLPVHSCPTQAQRFRASWATVEMVSSLSYLVAPPSLRPHPAMRSEHAWSLQVDRPESGDRETHA